jgi:hypothetical protein
VTAGGKQFMQKSLVRKGMVLGIIILFIGAGIVQSSIDSDLNIAEKTSDLKGNCLGGV